MIYRFGNCELDTARQELRRDGELLMLEPQVLSVLLLLLENRDRVVTKSELFDEVWEGRIVSDSALSSRVKTARQAIGDDGRQQTLIRTIHRQGFRFVGEVLLDYAPETSSGVARSSIAAEPVAEVAKPLDETLALPSKPSIAVLPFETLGDREGGHTLADGLTQDVITRLGRGRWLFVTARGSAFQFRGLSGDVPAAAAKLGVRYIAHGTIQFAGERIRVNVVLCDAAARSEIWAECYDRQLGDIFAIQDEMAEAIAGAIASGIDLAEQHKARLRPAESLDAWGAYHRGCWHLYQCGGPHGEQAERFLKRSAELDPNAPRTFAALSFVHWQRAFLELTSDRAGAVQRTLDYARQAMSLDPRDPQAHWALGRAYELLGEEQATREFEAAVALNPSSAMHHYALGRSYMIDGNYAASIDALGKALRLSPYDPLTFAMLSIRSISLSMLERHEEAVALARRAAWQPDAHHHLFAAAACTLFLAGLHDGARDYAARLRAARPGYSTADYLRAFPCRREEYAARIREALAALGLGCEP